MKKIPTIFKRDFNNKGRITNKLVVPLEIDSDCLMATEKLDGTNVRVTIRSGTAVRLEKRRNPTKLEKAKGVITPWYVDAFRNEPGDKHIWNALDSTNFSKILDGEWSGEALGLKIQGNPLGLDSHIIILFSGADVRNNLAFENVPISFDELKEWLPKQKSSIGTGKIEGIVWWRYGEPIGKIKLKDFKYEL